MFGILRNMNPAERKDKLARIVTYVGLAAVGVGMASSGSEFSHELSTDLIAGGLIAAILGRIAFILGGESRQNYEPRKSVE